MFSTQTMKQAEASRRPIIRILKRLLKGFGALLAVVILLAAAENNWLGYAWRSVQLSLQSDDTIYGIGNSPEAVMAAAPINEDGTVTILAVGDIVRCPKPEGIKQDLTTLASWVGLDDPLDHAKVPAVQTASLTQNWPTAPILTLGDIVYRRGTPHEFADCFDPIWGDVSPRTLPAPGNHEYYTPAAFAYFDYWGQQAGPERRGYYAVRHNSWLILSLNSEVDADPASPQGRWLAETLADSSEQCILAYYHRPANTLRPRSAGSEGDLFAQLATANADVILNGHNHFYERTHPMDSTGNVAAEGGTVSFVVGTGDKGSRYDVEPADFTATVVFGEQGLLRLDLGDDSYRWAFHSTNDATVLDNGSRRCGSV